jgi:hypothetical protein
MATMLAAILLYNHAITPLQAWLVFGCLAIESIVAGALKAYGSYVKDA